MNNRPALTLEVWNDAGLLREHTAIRYGEVLTYGGSYESWERAIRSCRRIAKLAKIELQATIDAIRLDYSAIEV